MRARSVSASNLSVPESRGGAAVGVRSGFGDSNALPPGELLLEARALAAVGALHEPRLDDEGVA